MAVLFLDLQSFWWEHCLSKGICRDQCRCSFAHSETLETDAFRSLFSILHTMHEKPSNTPKHPPDSRNTITHGESSRCLAAIDRTEVTMIVSMIVPMMVTIIVRTSGKQSKCVLRKARNGQIDGERNRGLLRRNRGLPRRKFNESFFKLLFLPFVWFLWFSICLGFKITNFPNEFGDQLKAR